MIRQARRGRRRAAVAVELAVLLPLVMFLAAIGVDYARVFSRTAVMETAARNGCVYACQDATKAADTAGIKAVAQKDLTDVSPTPDVTSSVAANADGFNYV